MSHGAVQALLSRLMSQDSAGGGANTVEVVLRGVEDADAAVAQLPERVGDLSAALARPQECQPESESPHDGEIR